MQDRSTMEQERTPVPRLHENARLELLNPKDVLHRYFFFFPSYHVLIHAERKENDTKSNTK